MSINSAPNAHDCVQAGSELSKREQEEVWTIAAVSCCATAVYFLSQGLVDYHETTSYHENKQREDPVIQAGLRKFNLYIRGDVIVRRQGDCFPDSLLDQQRMEAARESGQRLSDLPLLSNQERRAQSRALREAIADAQDRPLFREEQEYAIDEDVQAAANHFRRRIVIVTDVKAESVRYFSPTSQAGRDEAALHEPWYFVYWMMRGSGHYCSAAKNP